MQEKWSDSNPGSEDGALGRSHHKLTETVGCYIEIPGGYSGIQRANAILSTESSVLC